jgi:hypothetical protein
MHKISYTITLVSKDPLDDDAACFMACQFHQLAVEGSAESGETIYCNVDYDKSQEIDDAEFKKFMADAGYGEDFLE